MFYPDIIFEIIKYNNLVDLSNTLLVSKDFSKCTTNIITGSMLDTDIIKKISSDMFISLNGCENPLLPIESMIIGNSFNRIIFENNEINNVMTYNGRHTSLTLFDGEFFYNDNIVFGTFINNVSELPNNTNVIDVRCYEKYVTFVMSDGTIYIRLTNDYARRLNVVTIDGLSFEKYVSVCINYVLTLVDRLNMVAYDSSTETIKNIDRVEHIL